MAKKTATKAKTEDTSAETEDLELEDLDETVEETPAKKGKASEEVEFGASDLAAHLTKILDNGKTITPRDLRALIRKMAREETPRVEREIKAGNRSRYNWPGGLEHPEVKAIIAAVTGGELEADKQAKLAELKEKKAKQKAEKAKDGGKGKKGKKAAPVEEPEGDVEEIDLDDNE